MLSELKLLIGKLYFNQISWMELGYPIKVLTHDFIDLVNFVSQDPNSRKNKALISRAILEIKMLLKR